MNWFKKRGGLGFDLTFEAKDIIDIRKAPDGIKVFMDGKELNREAILDLKREAQEWRKSSLNAIIGMKLKAIALEKAINTSENWEQVLAGKMILYTRQIEESIIDALKDIPVK